MTDQLRREDTATEATRPAEIGAPRLRREDERLLTGRTSFTDDLQFPGMLHMNVVRSPAAHARITRVDVAAARAVPGVVAAYTGADLAGESQGLPCAWPVTPDMQAPLHRALATDKVRYVGDGVAVVLARDRYSAADGRDAVEVDYEPLPAVVDVQTALEDGTLVHDEAGTNRCYTFAVASGDPDEVARGEDVVVLRRRYVQQRLIPTAIEPRACVALPEASGYTIYTSTQIPHVLRVLLAGATGIGEHQLRVVAPDVGGGFGSKADLYAEEVLALVLARRLGRPVKWTESRSEGYQATVHGRDQVQDLEISASRDGDVRGLSVDLLSDLGAYLQLNTPGIAILGAQMFPGIYRFDAYRFRCTGVFTTKTPTDAYRGAGRPEATFAIERLMDDLAAELGMDPLELRRRNWIPNTDFPFDTVAGLTYDSGNYEAATDRALELFGYDELRAEQRRRRERGDPVLLGIGVSTYTEACGLAPSRALGDANYGAGGWEHGAVRVLPTGKVEVVTGSSAHGQGHETAWSQITADVLGVPFEDVDVLHGDTKVSAFGLDTYGSRSLVVGGAALYKALERVVDKARTIAAHLLEASEDDLVFEGGTFHVKGSPDAARTVGDVALAAFTGHDLPDGMEPNLNAECTFDPVNLSYPHGTHLCAVDVDTETGMPRIARYVCVDDVGRVVNPQIVEGQVHGGLAQGIAQALYEEGVYDADGNLVTGTLIDYHVPAAGDLPHYVCDRTETPATTNPLGAKGVGEAGEIASTPAVVNAIVDALRHLGVDDVRMPCTPQRVWRAIQNGRPSGPSDGEPH